MSTVEQRMRQPSRDQHWQDLAHEMGFDDDHQMWRWLYSKKDVSVKCLSIVLEKSPESIRGRLKKLGFHFERPGHRMQRNII
jgi:hypothetical protein